MQLNIEVKQGLADAKFAMPVEDVVAVLGQADEVECIDNASDESTTVLHYHELGLTLFFEGENPQLACIDVANAESRLFGEEVFSLDEHEIVKLMVAHDLTEQDVEDEDWGERRVSFPQGNIDFYFDEGELVSIIFGA